MNILTHIRAFAREEDGVTMIEYGLIAALIALAVAATLVTVGTNLNTLFTDIMNCLASPKTCTAVG